MFVPSLRSCVAKWIAQRDAEKEQARMRTRIAYLNRSDYSATDNHAIMIT